MYTELTYAAISGLSAGFAMLLVWRILDTIENHLESLEKARKEYYE